MRHEDLLTVQIQQREGRPEDVAEAIRHNRDAQRRNKQQFEKKHRLRPRKIYEGD